MHSSFARFCRLIFVLVSLMGQAAWANKLTCEQIISLQPGTGHLLGIVVGGRATGAHIPSVARELGYQIVHIYPRGLPKSVINSFTQNYHFPPISYDGPADLPEVAAQVSALAHQNGLSVGGFVAGMDYGAAAADWLAEGFKTPSNGRQWMAMRNDKNLMNSHLAAKRVPVAPAFSMTPENAMAQSHTLPYPLFGKARSSFASVGSAPVFDAASLPAALAQIRKEAGAMNVDTEQIFFEAMMNRDRIYFADTVHATVDGITHRITTGVWIDHRGYKFPGEDPQQEDFPKTVWDFIEMLPPPELLEPRERALFHMILEADQRMALAADITSGTSHTEYMSHYASPSSADQLFPTDVNHRLPGLRASLLEERTTGIKPFVLDILSRTQPEFLLGMPTLYSQWKENVALIFLRSYYDGTTTEQGRSWLESRYVAPGGTPPSNQAYFSQLLVPPAGTRVVQTVNGTTMVGTLHAVGPNRESIRQLLKEVRTLERQGFFVRIN
jgi:hypothetical protein